MPSDRPGYRKFVGETTGMMINATLIGRQVELVETLPAGAAGGIALGADVFYFAPGFQYKMIGDRHERSQVYVASGLVFPPSLLKQSGR